MLVEKSTIDPGKLRGRPAAYPFEKLNPGERLIIPCLETPVKDLRKKVSASISHYKRNNSLKWTTAVRIDADNKNILLYRIS